MPVSSFPSASNIFLIFICGSSSPFTFLIPDYNFREHLSRALPTENIFHLLRSTRSDHLMRDYSSEKMRDALEIIIKWLQVSVSECNRQTSN